MEHEKQIMKKFSIATIAEEWNVKDRPYQALSWWEK